MKQNKISPLFAQFLKISTTKTLRPLFNPIEIKQLIREEREAKNRATFQSNDDDQLKQQQQQLLQNKIQVESKSWDIVPEIETNLMNIDDSIEIAKEALQRILLDHTEDLINQVVLIT